MEESIVPAMSILLPVAILSFLAMAYVVYTLAQLLTTDGFRLRRPAPPRSHEPDMFEPHRFA